MNSVIDIEYNNILRYICKKSFNSLNIYVLSIYILPKGAKDYKKKQKIKMLIQTEEKSCG